VTGKQLQTLIDRAGLSQRGTAKLIDIGERTMRGYISGEHPIPLTVEYAVRWATQSKTEVNRG
jgi:plasmid maintenance system antidote protein VapI